MDFNKLTLKSQEAVAAAQELARRSGHPELTPDHLTVALLDQELPRTLVDRSGYGSAELRAEAEAAMLENQTAQGGATQTTAGSDITRFLVRSFEEMLTV